MIPQIGKLLPVPWCDHLKGSFVHMLLCTYELRKWKKSAIFTCEIYDAFDPYNFYVRGRCNMPFVWWLYLWFLSLLISVALAFSFTGGMTFFFLAEVPWVNFLLQLQLIHCWDFPSFWVVIILFENSHYTTLCSTGSFSIIFSHLLVLYSFTFFQFIALYPVRSCDSPKTSTGIRLHI